MVLRDLTLLNGQADPASLRRSGFAGAHQGFGETRSKFTLDPRPPLVVKRPMPTAHVAKRSPGTKLSAAPDLSRLLSHQSGAHFIDLDVEPADPTLAYVADLDFYLAHQCLPWRWKNREATFVASNPDAVRALIEEREEHPCHIYRASPQAICQAIQHRFYIALSERARFALARDLPESSAQHRLTQRQAMILIMILLGVAGLLWLSPGALASTLNIGLAICFLAISTLKGLSIFFARTHNTPDDGPDIQRVADDDLPVYSVLVPLFREAAVLPILMDALGKLDYPAAKLQVLLIFEESDYETRVAAEQLCLPDNIEFITVPHSLPLTKPKACNFALPFARGDYLVVFDAEDMPEPDQLRRALNAFAQGDERLACVQAHLNFYNQFENWLTRQFTLEYAAFFDLLLPTLERLNMPIPLGGTSTHFRTRILREVGAWDPFNVTEDADLGMRLAMLGLKTGVIRSTTYEEANCEIDNWLRQRSRWIKGWIQTYLVRMRHPVQLYRALGFRGFLGLQIIIGGFSLSNLLHPVFYLAILATLGIEAAYAADMPISHHHNNVMIHVAAAFNLSVLVLGYGISMAAGMVAATGRGLRPLVFSAFTMPIYWLLISLGAYKALVQLFFKPFHWEKTEHGISHQWAQRRATAIRDIAYTNQTNASHSSN